MRRRFRTMAHYVRRSAVGKNERDWAFSLGRLFQETIFQRLEKDNEKIDEYIWIRCLYLIWFGWRDERLYQWKQNYEARINEQFFHVSYKYINWIKNLEHQIDEKFLWIWVSCFQCSKIFPSQRFRSNDSLLLTLIANYDVGWPD